MNHILMGLALLILGGWAMVAWWQSFGLVMRGFLPIGLLGFGLIALLSGYARFRRFGDELEEDDEI